MRKLIYVIFCLLAVSCDIETSDNGDLDGYWQLKTVDTLSSGISADVREDGIFWAFQFDLMEAWVIGEDGVFFRFSHMGDSLRIYDPYIDNRDSGDIALTDVSMLYPMGISSTDETFSVLKLNSSNMELQSECLHLIFRKY